MIEKRFDVVQFNYKTRLVVSTNTDAHTHAHMGYQGVVDLRCCVVCVRRVAVHGALAFASMVSGDIFSLFSFCAG